MKKCIANCWLRADRPLGQNLPPLIVFACYALKNPQCNATAGSPRNILHRKSPTSTLRIYKKNAPLGVFYFLAVQGIFYLWLMKDLRPTIRTKGLKTGKNRDFLQKTVFFRQFYTTYNRTRPQIFGIFTLPCTKIPYKNNREFNSPEQGFHSSASGNNSNHSAHLSSKISLIQPHKLARFYVIW